MEEYVARPRPSPFVPFAVFAMLVIAQPWHAWAEARVAVDEGGDATLSRLQCVDCHEFAAHTSHPVDVKAPPSAALPLDAADRMTCTTCHDPALIHAADAAGNGETGLRQPATRLCAACHDNPDAIGLRRLAHASATRRAHPGAHAPEAAAAGLDADSRSCFGCHDGSVAAPGEHRSQRDELGRSPHPVGVRYDWRSKSGARSRLRPIDELPTSVRLPGNTVGCTSCHSIYSTLPGKLVMRNDRSRLCMTCHRM